MKRFLLFLSLLLVSTQSLPQNIPPVQAQNNIQYDQFQRVILNEDGKRINYPYAEEFRFTGYSESFNPGNTCLPGIQNGRSGGYDHCDPIWQYAIMGVSIGRKSLHTHDIDEDGIQEVICSAIYNGGYWYVLKYNPVTMNYEQSWVSEVYDEYIRRMSLADLNGDDVLEVIVGFDNGDVFVFNSFTKELTGQFTIPSGDYIYDIRAGDADNDSKTDLVVGDEDNLYIYDPLHFTLVSTLPYGCGEFRIGNVDADPELEIITTSGEVLEYDGVNAVVEWDFDDYTTYDNGYMVELSDIDSDGIKEIIRARNWHFIDVYDADIQAVKYQFDSGSDMHALLMKDVNGDGIDEIFYGDGQWGEIHCVNSETQEEIWQVDNPDHGVTGIGVADVDNDGTLEVIWGAGWTSTGGDYLHIASCANQQIEWTCLPIGGPFHAVDLADIDNDGVVEIVAVSRSSDSGYGSGIISVFDSQTYELEWQCDGDFLYLIWTGIFDVELHDVDADGVMEIIIAAGRTYTGHIWIIDGITKQIESDYIFDPEDISEFYVLSVADVDDDEIVEIIAGNEDGVYVINPSDFSVEWGTDYLSGYYTPRALHTGNTDNDPETEIVLCKGYIYVIDGKSHTQWQTSGDDYSAIDLYDLNDDGILEIVAGDEDGYITTFDGTTQQVMDYVKVCNEAIDGIKTADLNDDSDPEFIFTSEGTLYFYSDTNASLFTQRYGSIAGAYNGLKITDADNDGDMDIFMGSAVKILEIGPRCYECLWFTTAPQITTASCGIDDGSIVLNASGGVEPYSYSWSNGSTEPALYNLPAGDYDVTISDNMGCEISETLTVPQAFLITSSASTNVTCGNLDDGTAEVFVEEGTPPYSYEWSTGDTTAIISGLTVGSYEVTVEDAKNCTSSQTVYVNKDTLLAYLYKTDVSCYGQNNGTLETNVYEGTPPYNYEWSNGSPNSYLFNLPPGVYSVTILDAAGCSQRLTDTIFQPEQMITQITSTADDPNTPFGEGTATINVHGGIPPYYITWDDPFQQTGVTAINLPAGVYVATVRDNNYCYRMDTAYIDTALNITERFNYNNIKLFPNPSTGNVFLGTDMEGLNELFVQVHDGMGRLIFSENIITGGKTVHQLDLARTKTGLYCVSVILNDKKLDFHLEIIR